MSEIAQNCENYVAIFTKIYTLELYIVFTMVYSCCVSLGGNLEFLNFLKKVL